MKVTRLYVENVQAFNKLEYFPGESINLIYGQNGAGKSSFVEIFDLLTMIFKRQSISYDILSNLNSRARNELNSIFDLYNNYSTIGNEKNMVIEFDFNISGKNGSYKIEINKDNEVVLEQLDYAIKTRKSSIYKRGLNGHVETKYKALSNIVTKYDLENQNSIVSFIDFLKEKELISNDSEEFELIEQLTNMFMCNHQYHKNGFHIERGGVLCERFIVEEGQVSGFEEIVEKGVLPQFKEFVYQIDENILDIKYDTKYLEDEKKYDKSLVFTKELSGQLIDIPFSKESTGTKKYIEYFNYIHMAKKRETVFIWDEVGVNLHQNLANKIFDYMVKVMKENNRQMIMTSHSLSLLDSDVLANKEKQLIINNSGTRKIISLAGIDSKDKVSKKYQEGHYGAIPNLSAIWEFNE